MKSRLSRAAERARPILRASRRPAEPAPIRVRARGASLTWVPPRQVHLGAAAEVAAGTRCSPARLAAQGAQPLATRRASPACSGAGARPRGGAGRRCGPGIAATESRFRSRRRARSISASARSRSGPAAPRSGFARCRRGGRDRRDRASVCSRRRSSAAKRLGRPGPALAGLALVLGRRVEQAFPPRSARGSGRWRDLRARAGGCGGARCRVLASGGALGGRA